MSAIAEAPSIALPAPGRARRASVLLTLARRRASLTSKTPRQIAVPLLGPALLALVVAPALKVATGGLHSNIDYTSFVGVGAVGLVILGLIRGRGDRRNAEQASPAMAA